MAVSNVLNNLYPSLKSYSTKKVETFQNDFQNWKAENLVNDPDSEGARLELQGVLEPNSSELTERGKC